MKQIIKGGGIAKEELTYRNVGLLRLSEAKLSAQHFSELDIDEIGRCSIMRQRIVIGVVEKSWTVMRHTDAKMRAHCIIMGKKVIMLHVSQTIHQSIDEAMLQYEERDCSMLLTDLSGKDLFRAMQGQRTRKKAQISGSRRDSASGKPGTVGCHISTKRFKNSRLTCVCKCKSK